MREVKIHTQRYTKVICLDEPGAGGACHEYQVYAVDGQNVPPYATVSFQNGGIQDAGVNGCQNEDLLAIVIDRLKGFQAGEFAHAKNEAALLHLYAALAALVRRTQERIDRGVEGTLVK